MALLRFGRGGHKKHATKKKISDPRRKLINREGARLVKEKWGNLHVKAGVLSKYFGMPIIADDLRDKAVEKELTVSVGEAIKEGLRSKDPRIRRVTYQQALEITGYARGRGHGGQMGYWSRYIRGRKDENILSPYPGMGKGSTFDQLQQLFDLNQRLYQMKRQAEKEPLRKTIMAPRSIGVKGASPAQVSTERNPMTTNVDLFAIEIDGKLVEMDRNTYEIYKKQREESLKLEGRPGQPS